MSPSGYKCPECDADVSEDDEECPNCHASFVMEDEDTECPECGNLISVTTEKCPHCGTEFEIIFEEDETEDEEPTEDEDEPPEGPPVTEVPAEAGEPEAPETPSNVDEIDDQMDLDAEIERIKEEEAKETARRLEEEAMAEVMSQEQVDQLFQEAVEERRSSEEPKPDTELSEALDGVSSLLEIIEKVGLDTYDIDRLRDRTYVALHRGDREKASKNANEALKAAETSLENLLFYEQHFIGRALIKHGDSPEAKSVAESLNAMVQARGEGKFPEAMGLLDEAQGKLESLEPGFLRAEESFRDLSRAISVSERFLMDNRSARGIITQTRDLVENGRWKTVADLCDLGLKSLMGMLRDRAEKEFERIRSETAIAKRKGETGLDFLVGAAAEAQELMSRQDYVKALDRISRYREEGRAAAA